MKHERLKQAKVEKKGEKLDSAIAKEERQNLLFKTEALLPKTDVNRELEKFQLRNGQITTLKEVKDLIRDLASDYTPMFPNSIPFFSLMYKLNNWHNLNPNEFIKPPVVAIWIKQYVYGRFDRNILPSLLAKENPLISGYIRKYKLFQFLNEEGKAYLEQYINDMIDVMKISKDWEDFEVKYTKLYPISVQLKMKFSSK